MHVDALVPQAGAEPRTIQEPICQQDTNVCQSSECYSSPPSSSHQRQPSCQGIIERQKGGLYRPDSREEKVSNRPLIASIKDILCSEVPRSSVMQSQYILDFEGIMDISGLQGAFGCQHQDCKDDKPIVAFQLAMQPPSNDETDCEEAHSDTEKHPSQYLGSA